MEWTFSADLPIYSQLVAQIKLAIVSGVYLPGERLAPVRELAMELSINPNTIQRSYRQLEMEGWIATVPGKGCFVCGTPMGDPRQELQLLRQFEEAAKKLMLLGYTRLELASRLEQEEKACLK